MKNVFSLRRTAAVTLLILLATAGCREETTRPTYSSEAQSRIRAVQQAEMKRAAQQKQGERDQPPPSQAPSAGGAAPASGGGEAAARPATQGTPAPQPYLPPSEQGAYVEMTETPAGAPPPPARETSAPPAAGPAGAPAAAGEPPQGGGTGGNMPATLEPNANPGAPSAPPPPSGGGGLPLGTARPAVTGPSALPGRAAGGTAAAADAELERKLREFDELMKRAQAEADRERAAGGAGLRSGREDGRGGAAYDVGGAGGAGSRATGAGASPDLSGESGSGVRRSGPSARRMGIGEDDDIVARQLREAAERETDPVLQEKLWDEYRKYKLQ